MCSLGDSYSEKTVKTKAMSGTSERFRTSIIFAAEFVTVFVTDTVSVVQLL